MKAIWKRLLKDEDGAALVEFSLTFVMLLVITFGIVDFALAYFQWNSAEKATQLGARYAVESDPVAGSFTDYNAVDDGFVPGEDLDLDEIAAFTITCTSTACTNPSGSPPAGFDSSSDFNHDSAAFAAILARMQSVFPEVQAENLVIEYTHVGFGFAGRPGPDIVPSVTVRLQNMTYDLLIADALLGLTGGAINMPPFPATLVGEDLDSSA